KLVHDAEVDGVRNRNDQVGDRIDPDYLLRHGPVGSGDFDVIPANQVGAANLGGQQAQDRCQTDVRHPGEADRLFADVVYLQIALEGFRIHQDGNVKSILEKIDCILKFRIRIDALFELDGLGKLVAQLAD